MEQITEYTISNHAKQRYAERIMGKDDKIDASSFVTLHEEKIQTDINKMLQYGELIYTGRQLQKDGKGSVIDVYLKDCWVLLADNKTKNVITLYKIDLGLDDEFTKVYISKMMEKLNQSKNKLQDIQDQVQAESNMYKQMTDEAEAQIKEYRTMIKNLDELCVGYKSIIDNNYVKVSQANRDVAEVINTLIAKKEF